MKWYHPQMEPFQISGFAFYEKDHLYRRLPIDPGVELPEAVYHLADETAGGQIRFHARLKALKLQVSLASKPLYFQRFGTPHLTDLAKYGFDCYVSVDGGDYHFVGIAVDDGVEHRRDEAGRFYEATFFDSEEEADVDILLNFPLYGAVDKVLIGLNDEAELSAPQKKFRDGKKIVFYGGSTEQGACASRPGMCETNLLSRWLNREVYNLGFNSSGKAEAEVAQVIAQIPEVAAYVISTEGNCPDGAWLEEKLGKFLEILRQKNPVTPIVIMPFPESAAELVNPAKRRKRLEKLAAQQKIVSERQQAGDQNILLFSQDDCKERTFEGISVWHESSVDGLHKTDLGYYALAKGLYQYLKAL